MSPTPPTLHNSNDPMQLGLGPLMGVNKTPGMYSAKSLIDGCIESLKSCCLGMGSKVPEEVAAIKLAADLYPGEAERGALAYLMPDGVADLLRDKGLAALNAGVGMAVACELWPHLAHESWQDSITQVLAWRRARMQLKLLSRFETDTSTAGLAALKLWAEDARECADAPGNVGGPGAEDELRDAIIDDDELLGNVVLHLRARRQGGV